MLNSISKILTGDMLKVLCDMGHGDEIILADANFPAEAIACHTVTGKLLRCPGVDVSELYEALEGIFPIDADYTEKPACVMELTNGDKARNMPTPESWTDFERILHKRYPEQSLGKIERYEFYERAKKAYAVIQTGEERQYGNLLLVKGCVL